MTKGSEEIDVQEIAKALHAAMHALMKSQEAVVNLHAGLIALVLDTQARVDELEEIVRPRN